MKLIISPNVRIKLADPDHQVSEAEIRQAFANRVEIMVEDTRAWHRTNPPTLWFVAETDFGRKLKVMLVPHANGDVEIKSAYSATVKVQGIYNDKVAKQK
jgi:hypothetical protein